MYVCVAVLFVLTRLYVLINMGYTLTYFVPIHCMDANAVLFSRCNNVIWVTEDPRCGDDSLSCIYCADYHWHPCFVYSTNILSGMVFFYLSFTIWLTLSVVINRSARSTSCQVTVRHALTRRTSTWSTFLGVQCRHLVKLQSRSLPNWYSCGFLLAVTAEQLLPLHQLL